MSNGGVHILSANAGSMDRILLATDLLYKRIEHIRKVREQAGKCNTAPTLREIEKSHVLFVNAHFKPFASIAQEYERVQAQSGTAAFGSTVQFSIPQYGDFFADIAGRVRINPVECTAVTLGPTSGGTLPDISPAGGANFPYPGLTLNALGTAYIGTVEYVNKYGLVLAPVTGGVPTVDLTARNWVKYCDYPGLRLLRGVRFTVNGNPLDSYTSNVSTFYLNFLIPSDKLDGFKKLVGHEVSIDAFSNVNVTAGARTMADIGPVANDTSRRLGHVLDGPQTPKALQPQQVWMIPHWFWFCKDTRLAIASVSIPYGQRFIEWDLEVQNRIQYVVPGTDIYLRQHLISSVAVPPAPARAAQTQFIPYLVPNSTISTGTNNGAIAETTLFINNLFMQSEVHDIFIDRVGFSLIRLHRFQNVLLNAEYTEVLLNQLKWPIETIYSGVRPSENTADNAGSAVNWYKYGRVTNNQSSVVDISYDVAATAAAPDAVGTFATVNDTLFYDTLAPVCSTLKVESHGNTLWQELPVLFYNAYAPFQFGGANVITPKDDGVMMVNFALYPGSYQPSGHLNISRSREFHFDVQSTSILGVPQISSSLPAELVVYGVAINFLLISDGSAVIRYST